MSRMSPVTMPPTTASRYGTANHEGSSACSSAIGFAAEASVGSPVDRGRAGSGHHLLVDAAGIPLACTLTGGKRNDVTQLLPLLDAGPALRGRVGAPRRRPARRLADRGYDHDLYRKRSASGGPGRRSPAAVPPTALASVANAGWSSAASPGCTASARLLVRYERRADAHKAFLDLASCMICFRRLKASL